VKLGVVALAVSLAAPVCAAVKVLANDSFSGIGSISCQIGFGEGESAAVKLTAEAGDYPYLVRKIRVLVCPASTSGFAILRLYEDNTGTVVPGPLLYEEIVQVTGSDSSLNEVDLSLSNIVINGGSVRVELEWFQSGPPGLANDLDGIQPQVNYIYALPPGAWFYSEDLFVPGDWIVRMEIVTGGETPIFADGFESGDTTAWTLATP
jgi:hypothetical protein